MLGACQPLIDHDTRNGEARELAQPPLRPTVKAMSPRHFCFTAMAAISILASLTRAAAWIVARAGLGSGRMLL